MHTYPPIVAANSGLLLDDEEPFSHNQPRPAFSVAIGLDPVLCPARHRPWPACSAQPRISAPCFSRDQRRPAACPGWVCASLSSSASCSPLASPAEVSPARPLRPPSPRWWRGTSLASSFSTSSLFNHEQTREQHRNSRGWFFNYPITKSPITNFPCILPCPPWLIIG
jgi:hypothetical protein